MKSHNVKQVKDGCTIVPNEGTDRRNRTLINFLVNSPKSSMFIEIIDVSSYVKDGKKKFE